MGTKVSKLKAAVISEVENLSPRVRRIRLSGPSMVGFDWSPGDKIKVEAGDKLRSYTPGRVDPVAGWMDVIFFLHGNGQASRWAAKAEVGEAVNYVGPTKSMPGASETPDWALFMGDETTIGLAAALLESLPETTQTFGAIELDEPDVPSVANFGLTLDTVIRKVFCGEALVECVRV